MGLIYRGLRGYRRMVRKSGHSVARGARHSRYRREREAAYRRHRAAINRDREAFYRRRGAQGTYRAPQPGPGVQPRRRDLWRDTVIPVTVGTVVCVLVAVLLALST